MKTKISLEFYGGQLITPSNPTQSPQISLLPALMYWNVRNGSMKRSAAGRICNHLEKQFIIRDLPPALDPAILKRTRLPLE